MDADQYHHPHHRTGLGSNDRVDNNAEVLLKFFRQNLAIFKKKSYFCKQNNKLYMPQK